LKTERKDANALTLALFVSPPSSLSRLYPKLWPTTTTTSVAVAWWRGQSRIHGPDNVYKFPLDPCFSGPQLHLRFTRLPSHAYIPRREMMSFMPNSSSISINEKQLDAFPSTVPTPQLAAGYPFDPYKYINPSSLPYHVAAPAPAPYPRQPLSGSRQQLLPRDVLEQRARMPCKHFEHYQGWCPYGVDCHLSVLLFTSVVASVIPNSVSLSQPS
jgi:hypothetical protein